MTQHIKVCILSLYRSENLGEMAYTECVQIFARKYIPGVELQLVDIHGRDADKPYKESLFVKLLAKIGMHTWEKRIRYYQEDCFLRDYYSNKIHGADAVIIPGGGYIKCTPRSKSDRSYRYNEYFDILADVCEQEKCGLYFNAVGHTVNNNEDFEIKAWNNTFLKPAIRFLSCRDEIEFFRKVYPNAKLACCSAAYISELYNYQKDINSQTIGIGVIRPDAFNDYGFNVKREELIEFYTRLIEKIYGAGYKVKLFSNGLKRDQDFGSEIALACAKEKILIDRPEKLTDLLKIISSFKAVIVSRMHAAIIAYSFDIPALCLCWNNKHLAFMQNAGVPERAVYPELFQEDYVMQKLVEACEQGWPAEKRRVYRNTAIESIKEIFSIIRKDRKIQE